MLDRRRYMYSVGACECITVTYNVTDASQETYLLGYNTETEKFDLSQIAYMILDDITVEPKYKFSLTQGTHVSKLPQNKEY